MGWIGYVCREKFWHTFVARTFALIAPVWPILHRVSCCNETVQKTSNMYKTHHNISLGYNGVDRVRSLWNNRTRLHGTNFCINCTSSARFEPSSQGNKMVPNAPKEYETHQNMSLGSNGVDRVRSLRKIPTRLRGTNFGINCSNLARSAPSFML